MHISADTRNNNRLGLNSEQSIAEPYWFFQPQPWKDSWFTNSLQDQVSRLKINTAQVSKKSCCLYPLSLNLTLFLFLKIESRQLSRSFRLFFHHHLASAQRAVCFLSLSFISIPFLVFFFLFSCFLFDGKIANVFSLSSVASLQNLLPHSSLKVLSYLFYLVHSISGVPSFSTWLSFSFSFFVSCFWLLLSFWVCFWSLAILSKILQLPVVMTRGNTAVWDVSWRFQGADPAPLVTSADVSGDLTPRRKAM
jgi:hypothetical protein